MKKLNELSDAEVNIVIGYVETNFASVISDISPFVDVVAGFLYPGRYRGESCLFESAGKRKPRYGFEVQKRKFDACISSFPLLGMETDVAIDLIKSYFLNPIDQRFYTWGSGLYSFGPLLGQYAAEVPLDKQEQVMQAARRYKEIITPKSTEIDNDQIIVHEFFERAHYNHWLEVIKLICFITTNSKTPDLCTKLVEFMGQFYLDNKNLPFTLDCFYGYEIPSQLVLMEHLMNFPRLLGVNHMLVPELLIHYLKLDYEISTHDHFAYITKLRALYVKKYNKLYARDLTELRTFFLNLATEERDAVLKDVTPIMDQAPADWVYRVTEYVEKHKERIAAKNRYIYPVPQPAPAARSSFAGAIKDTIAWALGLK